MTARHIALGFAALTLTAHLLVAGQYEPHRDELLYLALGRHLHWGYASVPPMIGWLGALADALWANPVWGAKLWAALGGAAVAVVVGAIVQTLGGGRWATLAACYLLVFSVPPPLCRFSPYRFPGVVRADIIRSCLSTVFRLEGGRLAAVVGQGHRIGGNLGWPRLESARTIRQSRGWGRG